MLLAYGVADHRELLGELSKAAWEVVCDLMATAVGDADCRPGMVAALHTHGDTLGWHPHVHDNTLIKALVRAFRWKRMLESGDFATIADLADREDIAPSYMTRVLRLTLLAPEIVEAILHGRQGPEVALGRAAGAVSGWLAPSA